MKEIFVLISSLIVLSSGNFFDRNLGRTRHQKRHRFSPNHTEFQAQSYRFEQKLDHFDRTNENTWSQRYWRFPVYYKHGGPAFLFINGEWKTEVNWVIGIGEHWISYAKALHAVCFSLEHRYYGESQPKEDLSTPNLVYLSSEQALADIAYFIQKITESYGLPEGTKWIVFGCSYAGSLAAWARMKYPHLIHGAVSSSAPLLAKADFAEYYEVVKESLNSYSPKCVKRIAAANKEIENLVKRESGRKNLTTLFRLCNKLENDADDISTFFSSLAGYFAGAVQYNDAELLDISVICDIMNNPNLTELNSYAEVNRLSLKINDEKCLEHTFREIYKSLKSFKHDYESDDRQWAYQSCTEFGFYQSTKKTSDIFGDSFPVEFLTKECKEAFGQKFEMKLLRDGVYRTNVNYGGLKINVGNIIFVHGSLDPWHALGITQVKEKNATYHAIFINGTAHCADMSPPNDNDPESLKNARSKILEILRLWLEK